MNKVVLQETVDGQWKFRVYEDGEIKYQSEKFQYIHQARKEYRGRFGRKEEQIRYS